MIPTLSKTVTRQKAFDFSDDNLLSSATDKAWEKQSNRSLGNKDSYVSIEMSNFGASNSTDMLGESGGKNDGSSDLTKRTALLSKAAGGDSSKANSKALPSKDDSVTAMSSGIDFAHDVELTNHSCSRPWNSPFSIAVPQALNYSKYSDILQQYPSVYFLVNYHRFLLPE